MGSSITAAGVWLWMALIAIHLPISETVVFHCRRLRMWDPGALEERWSSVGPGASSFGVGLWGSPRSCCLGAGSRGQGGGRTSSCRCPSVCWEPWMPISVVMHSLHVALVQKACTTSSNRGLSPSSCWALTSSSPSPPLCSCHDNGRGSPQRPGGTGSSWNALPRTAR